MLRISTHAKVLAGCGLAAIFLAAAAPASAGKTFTTLYEFMGGSDGGIPYGALVSDASGNLYGTIYIGGDLSRCGNRGCGEVFALAPDGTKTVLHAFEAGKDGSHPFAGVIRDGKGNLYGTTSEGGKNDACVSCGTVFKIAAAGNETVLHAFTGGSDGKFPQGGLVKDGSGNLYGTTSAGGGNGCFGSGCGTVFKVTKAGVESVLYAFTGGPDGSNPTYGSLLLDAEGNLYGTASAGGDLSCPQNSSGCGVVFEIPAGGGETVLHAFAGGTDDGALPQGGVIADASGNLYGVTGWGGAGGCTGNGCGTVFELAPDGTEIILHSFAGGSADGAGPSGTLLLKAGNLFGTTQAAGSGDFGTVFKLSADGHVMLLHSFTGGDDGRAPYAGLLGGPSGSLFGTATTGGMGDCAGAPGCGTVFKLQ
jgi:uncharacterized repeat protein (TIGR03803 family)